MPVSSNNLLSVCTSHNVIACAVPNEDADLPLHLAFQNNASIPTIELLISLHPAGITAVGSEEQLPSDMAAENDYDMVVVGPLLSSKLPLLGALDTDKESIDDGDNAL